MKINRILRYICFLAVIFPLFSVASQRLDPLPTTGHGNSPKYLLTGTYESSSGVFDYYSINNNTEYAVALKSTAMTDTDNLSILSEYNSKPVTGIWRSGFYNCHATKITIPSSITTIDYEAFMGSMITTLTVPASVKDIGEGAFYYCRNLTKVIFNNTAASSEASSACSCIVLNNGNNQQRTPSELKLIPSFCFFNCISLKELVLPESIEEVGYEAFRNCYSMFSTLAFANIKTIRSRAFQDCKALKKVYISSSFFKMVEVGTDETTGDPIEEPVGIMEEKAFDGCNSNLEFYLVGDSGNIATWRGLSRNTNWNCKSALVAPGAQNNPDTAGANRYTYHITSAGVSYTNDWIYTVNNNEVEITSYIGPTEIETEIETEVEGEIVTSVVSNPVTFLTFPDELPSGSGKKVRYIATTTIPDSIKGSLTRIYLPKTLKRIEANMFTSAYTNLLVIDDNTSSTCTSDETIVSSSQDLTPRIILNNLTELEVIGNSAFVNMPKLTSITKLYLPYSLKAVGKFAFGSSTIKHMEKVTDFMWCYDDTKSALEIIGREAFYKLGNSSAGNSATSGIHKDYLKADGTHNYELTTLVIPRTFKHFGITSTESTSFVLGGGETDDSSFGISAFAGCPLLSKVIFKGSKKATVQSATDSTDDTDTSNLVIASQSFVMNESLRTVVFEERCGKSIVFHTAGGLYQPAIGWSSGKAQNDFSGDPALQTIVLPNTFTTLRFQNFALQGNSRGVIYLSGSENNKTKGVPDELSCAGAISSPASDELDYDSDVIKEWRTIGDEEVYSTNVYPGYDFAYGETKNAYGIDQKMPQYPNVLYKDTVSVNSVSIDVEVGTGNTSEFVISNKCAFVTNNPTGKATLTKYLYDRHDSTFTGEAKVPAKVTNSSSTSYDVTVIGASAFSAAYCDSTSYINHTNYPDLSSVLISNLITEIREYAFMRAYGVTKLSTYNNTNNNSLGDYVMPPNMVTVGKHAFAFCNIEQFLKFNNGVKFYETTSGSTEETSAFSNNFSLRKITFGNNATSSTYYTTTTYTHEIDENTSDTYTSALYSKSNTATNKSHLLLVLNRDSADYLSESGDLKDTTVTIDGVSTHYAEFDGQHVVTNNVKTKYLYGAFKMCYWIDSLVVGVSSAYVDVNQPLISGVYDVANGVDSLIYLNNPYDFTDNKLNCKLKSISFGSSSTLSTPPYSFEGCNQLSKVRLPRLPGQKFPAGLFALIENDIVFEVPSDATGEHFMECDPGVLDLTWTGYIGIATEAFKGTGIKRVIAPQPYVEPYADNPNNFVVETDAFANCEELVSIDFSKVTGTVTLNAAFRGAKIPNNLFNFGSSALIKFGAETFKGCKFPGHAFEFPVKTAEIGRSCFEGCNVGWNATDPTQNYALQTVTAAGNLTYMERITTATEIDSQNNKQNNYDKKDVGFKQIGNYAFYLCYGLMSFDFSKFTELERIGHYAFSMNYIIENGKTHIHNDHGKRTLSQQNWYNATICTGGVVELPSSLTNIGCGAFHSTKITSVTIQSSSMKFERGLDYSGSQPLLQRNRSAGAFRYCPLLTKVFFANPDCAWKTAYETKARNGQDQIFGDDLSLSEVYLPAYLEETVNGQTVVTRPGYDMHHYKDYVESDKNNRPDSLIYASNDLAKIYSYNSLKDFIGSTYGFDFSKFWRRFSGMDSTSNSVVAPIVFYVADHTDVVKQVNGQWVEIDPDHEFWTVINGEPVKLGTFQGVTADNGNVTVTLAYTKDGVTTTYHVTSSGVSVVS